MRQDARAAARALPRDAREEPVSSLSAGRAAPDVAPPPFDAFLADLAALGVRPVGSGGVAYGMVKARGNERWWLTPLGSARASEAGLSMFQPMTRSARLAKAAAVTLVRLRLEPVWARERLRLSGLPRFPGRFDEEVRSCAYFTGTAGPHRKTAIQFMGAEGRILGYGKLSRTPSVRAYVDREPRMLREVRALGLRSASTPEVLAHLATEEVSLLVTDSLRTPASRAPKELGVVHLDFLRELAARTGRSGAEALLAESREAIARLATRLPDPWMRRLEAGIARLAPEAGSMPLAMAHGDFTPWNSLLDSGRLYVFDWEYARDAAPLGHDLAHFRLSAAWPHWPPDIADRLTAEIAAVFHGGDRRAASRALLLFLLLHSVFYLARAPEDGAGDHGWAAEPHHARLIDAILDRGEP